MSGDPDEDFSRYCARCLNQLDYAWLFDNDHVGFIRCPICRRELSVIRHGEMLTESAIRRADTERDER